MTHMRLVLALLAGAWLLPAARAPQVKKIEPPSWWQGSSWNPIRLLIRGVNLGGAKLTAPAGFQVSRVASNEAGTYLFADLRISPQAKPGSHSLTVLSAAGKTNVTFSLLPPLDRKKSFQGFSSDDLIYLIMPDRFANGDPSNDDPPGAQGLFDRTKTRFYHGGDFQGIIDRLPYLRDLGVTAIWLTPWYDNVDHVNQKERYDNQDITDYHGYGAVDFYGVEQHFGDLAKLRELAVKAHAAGIKLIQDQVVNHTGPYHPWVEDPPMKDWFHGTAERHLANEFQAWTLIDPNSGSTIRRKTLDGWFVDILPDLNQDNPETRRYLIQNALWWVGVVGIDGIRQDTMAYVPRGFWTEWSNALHKEFPKLKMVGEVLEGDPALTSFFQGGRTGFDGIDTRMDSVFDFPLMFTARAVFAGGAPAREIAKLLAHDRFYARPAELVTTLGVHDIKRFLNEAKATEASLRMAFTLLFTVRGIPMVYYGDEIAMPGGEDPDNRRDFPGGFPGDSANAFREQERTPAQQAMFLHVKKLAAVRQGSQALRQGTVQMLVANDTALAFARQSPSETAIAVWNTSDQPASVVIDVSALKLRGDALEDRLTGKRFHVDGGVLRVELGARDSAVLF